MSEEPIKKFHVGECALLWSKINDRWVVAGVFDTREDAEFAIAICAQAGRDLNNYRVTENKRYKTK